MTQIQKLIHLIDSLTASLAAFKEAMSQEPAVAQVMLTRTLKRGRPQKYTAENTKHWGFETKPDIVISREQGISIVAVTHARRRLGFSAIAAPDNPSSRRAQWMTWNWELNDSQLATEHCISRERARQIRAELGLPARRKINSEKTTIQFERFKEWLAGRLQIEFLEAKHQGFNECSIKKWCRKLRVSIRCKHNPNHRTHWGLVNWNLPNWMIEEAWGMPYNTAASKRSASGKPKGPYVLRKNVPPEIQVAFDLEKAKAKKFRQEHAR